MNNPFFLTLICWQTRNWRHTKKAVTWCKNYGLTPLTNNFYLGKLKGKEIDALMQQFQGTFTKKTERHYLITLCKSCYERTELAKIKKSFIEQQPFEIVG